MYINTHTHTFVHTTAAAAILQGHKWPRAQQQMHQEKHTQSTLTFLLAHTSTVNLNHYLLYLNVE